MILVDATALRGGTLAPPLSKSDAQRALVLAHVLGEPGKLGPGDDEAPRLPVEPASGDDDPELPADVVRLRAGLRALAGGPAALDCGDGGAPFRFLVGQAAITPGTWTFTGSPRLAQRPHRPLLEALRASLGGAGLRLEGHPWPLVVRGATGRAEAPCFELDAAQSSQHASSLLLVCAALCHREQRPWSLRLRGAAASEGYLAMTLGWLERAGFGVSSTEERGYRIAPPRLRGAPAQSLQVPGDWSSLGYLLLCAWRTGGLVAGVELGSPHPDRAVVRILAELGVRLEQRPEGVAVQGAAEAGLRASGLECPDLLPTLAALACVLPSPSTLEHVRVLEAKESDRLAGIRDLVAAAGGATQLQGDTLTIQPPRQVRPAFAVRVRADHRMAMAAATLAVLSGGRVQLDDAECVHKSFPGFWRELGKLGVRLGEP